MIGQAMASPDSLDDIVERIIDAAIEYYSGSLDQPHQDDGSQVYAHFEDIVRDLL
jgi:hypothetical protein